MRRDSKVPNSTGKALFCLALGFVPLALDAAGFLGAAWPRGTLPAGMSRLALALLPWFLFYGAPFGKCQLGARGLLLGLPLFALAAVSDHAAGVPASSLVWGGLAALAMVACIGSPAPSAETGIPDRTRTPGRIRGAGWFLLVIAPVALALVFGYGSEGAPLAPGGGPAWLSWSPLGWCLLWAAENPGLEPRSNFAPYGALIVSLAIALVPALGHSKSPSEPEVEA